MVRPTRPEPASTKSSAREAARQKALARAEKEKIEIELEKLEETVFTQRKLQVRLEHDLAKARQRLAAAQIDTRKLTERATELGSQIESNNATAVALKERISDRSVRKIEDLEKRLAEEQRRSATQQVVVQQREKEIDDLRRALSARDEMLRERNRVATQETKPVEIVREPARTPVQDAVVFPAVASERAATPENVARRDREAVVVTFDPYASVPQLVLEGNRLLREGLVAEAEQQFAAALLKEPASSEAKFGLASCRYTDGDLYEAKRLVDEVIKIDSRNAQALGLSGIIAWRQGELRSATRELSRAVKLDQEDAQLHNYLGIVLYAQDKREHAVRELKRSVELNPSLAEARFNLAIMLATGEKASLEEARHHYQASLRLGSTRDPKLEKILYQ